MSEQNLVLRFSRRPSPVLPEHRPLYKIGQLLLVLLLASRGGRSSLPRLHLFNWALKRPERIMRLRDALASRQLKVNAWGFDPALAIALQFAAAEGLVRTTSNAYELTDRGELLAEDISKATDLFRSEKEALEPLAKGITEGMVEAVAKGWEA